MRKGKAISIVLVAAWYLGAHDRTPVMSLSTAAAADSSAASNTSSRLDRVIVAFKTHFDIGYTDMAVNVVRRYRTEMIDQALQVGDRNQALPAEQRFVWTVPGWPMKKILDDWDGQTAERKERVWRAYREGLFVTHALPFTTHTELLEIEDLVRGMQFSSQLSRTAGLPLPRDAKMTDVPCHSWIMPTLLRHAGVDFLHLGCNSGSSSPEVPLLFWWEGPDGSRLLTMYAAEGYGTGLVPPQGWPHKTWLALIHTGDNAGPPKPEHVQQLLAEAAQKLPGVQVRIGRLSDFADALLAEKPDLPVVRGDMPDTWIHGPMCDPAGARIARNIRPQLAACESLHTHLGAWGVDVPSVTDTIAAGYENSLLYGEHTWGGALYWITSYAKQHNYNYGEAWVKQRADGGFKRLEDSWNEHTAYIERARDLIGPTLQRELGALARAVRVAGPRFVVYNPLPWPRDGLVELPGKGAWTSLKDIDTGEIVPLDGDLARRFVARQVPAMGYRTYVSAEARFETQPIPLNESQATLESPFFKAVIDTRRGVIRSLIAKESARDLVDADAPHGFGQYLYERFDADQVKAFVKAYVKSDAAWAINEIGKPAMPPADQVPYRASSPEGFTGHAWQTPIGARMVLRASPAGGSSHPVETTVQLYRDLPCVDIELCTLGKMKA